MLINKKTHRDATESLNIGFNLTGHFFSKKKKNLTGHLKKLRIKDVCIG